MRTGRQIERETNVVEIASSLFLRNHVDAWAALSAARLSGPEEAVFRLYALQEWHQWKPLERATLAGMAPRAYAAAAAQDAMARILWRCAPMSIENRSRDLRVRTSDYRAATRQAEALLRSWLHLAALAYLHTLGVWDGFTPRTEYVGDAKPACMTRRSHRAQPPGQFPLLRAA